MFVDGGRVPPATTEVRRAALIINYTPKDDRDITQRELELEIGKDLENVPDIRYWFLDDNGLRALSLIVTGPEIGIVNHVANELAMQMRRIPLVANVTSGDGAGPAGAAHPATRRSRRAARRLDRRPVGNHPRRHDRRRRPGAGEVRRRRPADPDPRAVRRKRPLRPEDARATAGAVRRRARQRAAVRRRRHPARSGTDQHQSL